jgi:hypothetical protein
MKEAGLQERVLGRVAVAENDPSGIGYWSKVHLLSGVIPFREVVFCEGTLTFKNIIESISLLPQGIVVKFHAAGSSSIVGSKSKDRSGEFVSKENGFKLNDPHYRRLKRLMDVTVSFVGLVSLPIQLFLVKKPISFFGNCFSVLFARKTWIGYAAGERSLPRLRKGIIACNGVPLSQKQELPTESLQMIDYWYARDYRPSTDIRLIKKVYKNLGS